MKWHQISAPKTWWPLCGAVLRRWLQKPADPLGLSAGRGLEIALRPHVGSCRWVAVFSLLQACYAADLIRVGRLITGFIVLGLAALGAALWRTQLCPVGPAAPRRLRLQDSGQLLVFFANGDFEPVTLRARSMVLGGLVLLVVQGRRQRLLILGTQNVPQLELAALRRRLRVLGLRGSRVE
jgi:hypothetical protein